VKHGNLNGRATAMLDMYAYQTLDVAEGICCDTPRTHPKLYCEVSDLYLRPRN